MTTTILAAKAVSVFAFLFLMFYYMFQEKTEAFLLCICILWLMRIEQHASILSKVEKYVLEVEVKTK